MTLQYYLVAIFGSLMFVGPSIILVIKIMTLLFSIALLLYSSVLKGRLSRHWPTLLFSGILCTVSSDFMIVSVR